MLMLCRGSSMLTVLAPPPIGPGEGSNSVRAISCVACCLCSAKLTQAPWFLNGGPRFDAVDAASVRVCGPMSARLNPVCEHTTSFDLWPSGHIGVDVEGHGICCPPVALPVR